MLRILTVLSVLPLASAVYQLEFLGDYQTGAWDTDAAENVAYDSDTKRAFVASAESSSLEVIDISDPTVLSKVATLPVGTTMGQECTDTDCFYEDFDFGGGSAPCGYAPMINIIFEYGDCDACASTGTCSASDCPYTSNPGYNRGTLSVDATVATPEGCMARCQSDTACEHYSWETEVWTAGSTTRWPTINGVVRTARCFLKGTFGTADRDGNPLASPGDCDSYVHWEAHKSPTARATHCNGVTEAQCNGVSGASWESTYCDIEDVSGGDTVCTGLGGTVSSTDWAGGPRYPYGFAPGNHYSHVYDKDWAAGSGPKFCKKFVSESVQSVAVTRAPGYPNNIVVVASPHKYDFAKGMLAFYDADTLQFLACGPAGNKPEGIASTAHGKVSCINEGSALDLAVTPIDVEGSMTICDVQGVSGVSLSVNCQTKDFSGANFAAGAWKHAVEYRVDGVRLFGPNGNNVTYDVEPEGGAFTEDGKYQLVVLQDNDAYAMYDVEAGKFLFMRGFAELSAMEPITLDGSDKDDKINIHDIGSAYALKIRMPDQVTSFTHNGEYYFVTANEGGTRDGGDGLLGEAGDFDGEEVRLKDVPCAGGNANVATMCEDGELGRILTTGYMPSDYALNACGNNLCSADGLLSGTHTSADGIIPGIKGSGAFKCIYKNADYGGCGSVCNLHDDHYMWHDPSGCSGYPPTLAHYVDSDADNAYYGAACTAPNCDTRGWQFASWATLTGVDAGLAQAADSPNPLGYDGAVRCQELCELNPDCDHFYYEFEMGKSECFLKDAFATESASCHEYSYKDDKYEYSVQYQAGTPGVKPYVAEGYASWGGPKSSLCTSPAPYTITKSQSIMPAPGVTGGVVTVGGRSVSIYKWDGTSSTLSFVWDSGSIMEEKQAMIPGGRCDGCTGTSGNNQAGQACKDYCPFNSDEAPPKLDDRSDAKGPEPECVTVGTMPDGKRLLFVGMERTGGVMTFDISDPTNPEYNDFLNVRNWLSNSTDMARFETAEDAGDDALSDFMIAHGLNDGPESMVFINDPDLYADPILLAATPLAGRLTAYAIKSADATRADDGSCPQTAGCPYLPKSAGGTGEALRTVDVTIRFTASGSVNDYDDAKKTAILNKLSEKAGLGTTAPAGSTVTVTAASVNIECMFPVTKPEADAAKRNIATNLPSLSALNAALQENPVLAGVQAETEPTVVSKPRPLPVPPASPNENAGDYGGYDNGPLIGGIVGGVCGAIILALCVTVFCFIKREKAGQPIFQQMGDVKAMPAKSTTADSVSAASAASADDKL